jgi:uncharacterized paraquat-inducible protein A
VKHKREKKEKQREHEQEEEETLYDTEMRCPTCETPLYLQERDALHLAATRHCKQVLVILRCVCGQLIPFSYDWDAHPPLH